MTDGEKVSDDFLSGGSSHLAHALGQEVELEGGLAETPTDERTAGIMDEPYVAIVDPDEFVAAQEDPSFAAFARSALAHRAELRASGRSC